MAVLVNGTESLDPGATPAQSYAKTSAALQKLAQMNLHEQVVRFNGLVRDNAQRGKSAVAVERVVTQIEIHCDGDAPTGSNLTLQLVVNGSADSNVYSLTAGQGYVLLGAVGGGLVVAANATLEVKVTAANGASDVVVTLKSQLRIL
jgi:hypothetical protein